MTRHSSLKEYMLSSCTAGCLKAVFSPNPFSVALWYSLWALNTHLSDHTTDPSPLHTTLLYGVKVVSRTLRTDLITSQGEKKAKAVLRLRRKHCSCYHLTCESSRRHRSKRHDEQGWWSVCLRLSVAGRASLKSTGSVMNLLSPEKQLVYLITHWILVTM